MHRTCSPSWLALLATALLLPAAGCRSETHVSYGGGDDPARPWARQLAPNVLALELEVSGTRHRARLEDVGDTASDVRAWRLLELEPRPAQVDAAGLAWLFTLLPPQTDVLSFDGLRLAHPDRARLARLGELGAPPALAQVVAVLPGLLRFESRAAALRALRSPLPAEEVEPLLAALAEGGAALQRTPEGLLPGGGPRELLHAGLGLIAAAPALTPAQAERAVRDVPRVDWDSYEGELLRVLAGKAPLQLVLDVGACVGSRNEQHALLLALAERARAGAEADAVARAAPRVDWDSYERAVLVAVAEGAGMTALLGAGEAISSRDEQRALLLRLVERARDRGEGEAVAAVAHRIDWDSYEGEVLQALARSGKASLPALVAAGAAISSRDEQHALLMCLADLAKEPALADQVAGAAPRIDWDSYEREVLVALADQASLGALLAAGEHVASRDEQHALLARLARRARTAAEADLVARVTPRIDWDSYEREVLVALAARAGVATLLAAGEQLSSRDEQRALLLALAARQGLSPEEADLVARAAPRIDWDSYEAEVLLALADEARLETLLAAGASIGSRDARRDVLLALSERAPAGAAADRVARAARGIDWDSYEQEVLVALSGKAGVAALLESAGQVASRDAHHAVLLALTRRTLSPAEADAVAAATPALDWDSYEVEVLLALVGKASKETLRDAAANLRDADRARVLDALLR